MQQRHIFLLCFHVSLLFNYLGKPLYPDASEFKKETFGFVMHKVLLPMALDYHVRSREIDINELAADQLPNLNGDEEEKNHAIEVRMLLTIDCSCLV